MKYFVISVLCIAVALSCQQKHKTEQRDIKTTALAGAVFGTRYSVIYNSEINYAAQFDSLFHVVNTTLSTYSPDSDISKLNRNEQVSANRHFKTVFQASKRIHAETKGIFDPTIGDVVNAWDFGAEHHKFLTDSTTIDSLMQFVGFDKVKLAGTTVVKPLHTYLEFNAIAKGYGVDVISDFLVSKGITNYLVEIGGELRVKGQNMQKQKPWRVGLDEPRFDGEQSVYKVIHLKDEAMATSGTYRKFKVDAKGNRYAHIINTATGYPAKTSILSVSVIAKNCMLADGYATAFQAMGILKLKPFLKQHPELKVFIIYENEMHTLKTLAFNGFPIE